MPKQSTAMIPLLCDLCPKKPRFSDVSHLLTHISSKSHLSNRFKLQIRSQGEPEAKKLLADFDLWYIDNGLEDLLSERLSAKEQKKSTKRDRTQFTSAKSVIKKAETRAELKVETKSGVKDEDRREQPLAATPAYRPPIPRMHSWSTDPYVADFAALAPGSPWTLNSVYETPTMKRNIPNFSRFATPGLSSTELIKPTPLKVDDTEYDVENDGSKLKGIYWPGMDLFDSATAEMKRMRNQKKDGTALQQMKRSSAVVEPNEWVFNADGGLRKIRDIFDDSAESSPDSSVAPPTPKKRRNRKGPMTEISANAPRLRPSVVKPNTKSATTKRKLTTADLAEMAPKKKARRPILSSSRGVRFSPRGEEDSEFRLTMGDFGKRPSLGIFRDAEASPAHTESPLEGHRFDLSIGPTLTHTNSVNVIHHSPTPLYKPVPMRLEGKENAGPGQIARFTPNSSNGFHPDIFHSDSLNPLYTHSHAHVFSYGDRSSFLDEKPAFHTFGGDFKPMMLSGHFNTMSESHRLPQIPGSSMADNIRYGM